MRKTERYDEARGTGKRQGKKSGTKIGRMGCIMESRGREGLEPIGQHRQ